MGLRGKCLYRGCRSVISVNRKKRMSRKDKEQLGLERVA